MRRITDRHLIEHPSPVPLDAIDQPTIHALDMRQDAAVNLIRSFTTQGVPIPMAESDLATFFATHEGAVVNSLNQAVGQEIRRIKRRHSDGPKEHPLPFSALPAGAARIADPRVEEDFAAVEATATDELSAFLTTATPAERDAVTLLAEIQRLKAQDIPLSDGLRSKLKRLRQRTGLPLDISLL